MNGKSVVIAVGVAVVLIGGGYLLLRGDQNSQPQASISPTVSPTVAVSPSPSPTASGSVQGLVKTFAVSGKPFSFNPKEIKVNKGDTVKIVFTNTEGLHDWVIDEFNARTPQIQAGKTAEVTFIADKAGSFQYYCSVGNHRAQGMWGTLIVQ